MEIIYKTSFIRGTHILEEAMEIPGLPVQWPPVTKLCGSTNVHCIG